MDAARFKAMLAATTALGLVYLVYDFAAARIDPSQPLSGTILIEGRPMAKGIVRFISIDPDKPLSFGSYVKDGRYQVPAEFGITPARYQVEFSSIGAEDLQRMLAARQDDAPVEIKEEVPARFNRNSEVQLDLTSGTVVQADFDLR